ncbi:MAG: hypothetical protein C0622_02315 [Desulfuromonas sp.]|nr:MAG: hypothetical protein C0622_02315 [Desulfuromonas sp.]
MLQQLLKEHPDIRSAPDSGLKQIEQSMPAGCILCGLCVAICRKIGRNKLSFIDRGKRLGIVCLAGEGEHSGCGSCHVCRQVCPCGYISDNGETTFTPGIYAHNRTPQKPEHRKQEKSPGMD